MTDRATYFPAAVEPAILRTRRMPRMDFLVLAISILAFGGLSILMGIDKNFDLRNYHLYIPYAYLNGRYFQDIGPGQQQSYFNPALDFLFYGLVRYLNHYPQVIAFIMGGVH